MCASFSGVWSCPEGYKKMWEDCIKIVPTKMKFVDAKIYCSDEGATLARPQTIPDVRNPKPENREAVNGNR
jgi:hypothetical protein